MDSSETLTECTPETTQTAPIASQRTVSASPWAPLAPARRCTEAVTRRRVEAIATLMADGVDRVTDLWDWSEQTDEKTGRPWHVTHRTMQRYHARACLLLSDEASRDRATNFARHLGMRRRMYKQAIDTGQLPAALAVAKDEAELLGLYPDKATPPAIGTVNVIAASVQQAIADPRYVAWLESQASEPTVSRDTVDGELGASPIESSAPYILDTTAPPLPFAPGTAPAIPHETVTTSPDDLPSCDELDSFAVDLDISPS